MINQLQSVQNRFSSFLEVLLDLLGQHAADDHLLAVDRQFGLARRTQLQRDLKQMQVRIMSNTFSNLLVKEILYLFLIYTRATSPESFRS